MKRTRLVVVNPSIAPAVRIKEALERTRRFVVTPFADAFAALDFLRQQKQDMIIIDMGMTDYPGDELIRAVLEIQPDITVVANTSDSGMAASAVTAGAGYLLDERYTAREVLNILEQALEAAEATKDSPDTATPPKVQKPKLTETDTSGSAEVFERIAQEEPPLPDFDESGTVTDFMAISPDDLDEMVNTPPGGVDSVEYIDDDDDDPVSDDTAAQLILETAAQDRRALSDLPFDTYLSRLRDGQGNVSESYVREPDFLVDELFFDEVVDDTAEGVEQPTEEAELTLEEILATGASNSDRSEDEDEEISVNDLSVQDSQDQVDIDLLSEVLDAAEAGADAFYDDSGVITDQEASGSTEAEAVYDDSGEVLDSAEAVEPQIVEESAASDEVYVDLDEDEDDDPFAFPEPDPVDVWGESAADLATTEESLDEVEAVSDAVEDVWDEPEFAIDDAWGEPAPESQYSPPMTKMSVLDDHILRWNLGPDIVIDTYDDPRVTQLAVSLTQASLESTGEAVLLTRSYELVAYEGALSDADIAEFMSVIVDGWEDVEETQARIRYLTLSSNGLDYMVYSRRTHEDFILSMVFAGQTSLRDIRQQGKRIVAALKSVPDTPPEIEDDPEVSLDPDDESNRAVTKPSRGGLRLEAEVTANAELMDYSFVWLLRDPNLALEHPTGEAINAGLRVQLVEQGWQVHALKVEEDYVYLYAGVPGDLEPQGVVRELQERSAKIAQKQDAMLKPNLLWAESYFVLSPGRELNVQEIQQYINFCRM